MYTSVYMTAFLIVNLLFMFTNIFQMWRLTRKETFAVILSKNNKPRLVKIKRNRDFFKYDKCAYIIPKERDKFDLRISKKIYLRYVEGTPEPFEWVTNDKPEIPGDVLHSILDNEGLKLLNKPPLAADFMKWVLIGGAVIVVVLIFTSSGGGG